MEENPLLRKSYMFALHATLFCKRLMEDKREYVLSKQLIRSGTSVGARIEEAQQAESRKDFISKISGAMKEAYESRYWIRLIRDAGYMTKEEAKEFLVEVEEVIALLGASIKTAKRNLTLSS